jgi:nucleoside-diphosphate-sugar epimerase
VLAACRRHGIPHLVHTSTPSVVSCGEDLEGVDESRPIARRFLAHYPATKALAEQAVRAADSPSLRTIALRPHLVWGPGDAHLLPRLVARRRAGRLRRITLAGAAEKRIDTTYIDDAARAHLLAADALRGALPGRVGGRAYFISSGRPIGVWTMIDRLLAAAGLPPVEGRVSPRRARLAGAVLETLFHLLRIRQEPPLTRWVALELSTAHWFDIGAARRDLGYEPQVDLETGMARLQEWWRSIDHG